MPILASRLQSQMAASLDAGSGSSQNRYTFFNDYKYAINYAARKLLEWASTHQGSTKFNSEALRELRHIWVFQTSKYSRVEIPESVNTINAVYPEILISPEAPSIISNITTYSWDIKFAANHLSLTTAVQVSYNSTTYFIDLFANSIPLFTSGTDILDILDDFFNDMYGLNLGDVFGCYPSDGPLTAISYSGTLYGEILFLGAHGTVVASIVPTITSTTTYDWSSFKRDDVVFLDVVKDAKRITDEQRAHARGNVFSHGFEDKARAIKLYSYTEITDFNSAAYIPNPGKILREIQIDPDVPQKFVAIALVENYTEVVLDTDFASLPEEFFNLMVQCSLIWIRAKQSQELLNVQTMDLLQNSVKNYGMS